MVFHITQVHTPETCPKNEGGSKALYTPDVEGLTIRAIYGAFAEHTIFYVVEAESIRAVHEMLLPGFERCTCDIRPVTEVAIID